MTPKLQAAEQLLAFQAHMQASLQLTTDVRIPAHSMLPETRERHVGCVFATCVVRVRQVADT